MRQNNFKFSSELYPKVLKLLKMLCWREPTLTLKSYCDWIDILFGIKIGKSWVSDVLYNELGYSIKK